MKKEKEFNLSECGERDFNGPWLYPENYVKEFIRNLKEDRACWLCGSGYIRKDGRKEYRTGLCDICHNLFNDKQWKALRERRNTRIDKLAGPKLIK